MQHHIDVEDRLKYAIKIINPGRLSVFKNVRVVNSKVLEH